MLGVGVAQGGIGDREEATVAVYFVEGVEDGLSRRQVPGKRYMMAL